MKKNKGYFSKDGKEFILNDPRLSMPYIHYLSNGRYCAFLTHTGGGLSFWKTQIGRAHV